MECCSGSSAGKAVEFPVDAIAQPVDHSPGVLGGMGRSSRCLAQFIEQHGEGFEIKAAGSRREPVLRQMVAVQKKVSHRQVEAGAVSYRLIGCNPRDAGVVEADRAGLLGSDVSVGGVIARVVVALVREACDFSDFFADFW